MNLGHVARRGWLKSGGALMLALVAIGACSDSKGDDAKTDGGVSESGSDSAIKELEPTISEWANTAVEGYAKQVAAGSALDYAPVAQEIKPASSKLSKAICDELKGVKDSEALRDSILLSADEAFAREFAKKPELLIATGMSTWGLWPPFALKDPAPAPTAPVDGTQALPQVIKPDFLTSGGGLIIPKTGDSSYEDFRTWFYDPSLDNKLLERAMVTSVEVRNSAESCPK